MADYDKVGLLTVRRGKILLCRKKHTTSALILPGGCKAPGESALDCLARELREELGDVQVSEPEYLGVYSDRAAGSEAKTVDIELYRADRLVAAAYAERRTTEMRLTNLPYAAYNSLPVERGGDDDPQRPEVGARPEGSRTAHRRLARQWGRGDRD